MVVEELFIHQTDFGRSVPCWNCHRARGFTGLEHGIGAQPPAAVHACFVRAASTWPQERWLNLHNTCMVTAGGNMWDRSEQPHCALTDFLHPPHSRSSSRAAQLAKQPRMVGWGNGFSRGLTRDLSLQVLTLLCAVLQLQCSLVPVGALIQHPPDCTPLKIFHLG